MLVRMSDPTQQPPSDPYRPQEPYQPQAPYQGPGAPGGPGGQVPPQSPYPPYGYAQPGYPMAPKPNHPQATTALVLGATAVGSIVVVCGILLFLAPVAWIMGGRAVKEIDASNGALGGRNEAQMGYIFGIVGTVLLILALIAAVVVVSLIIVAANDTDSSYSYEQFLGLVMTGR